MLEKGQKCKVFKNLSKSENFRPTQLEIPHLKETSAIFLIELDQKWQNMIIFKMFMVVVKLD